MLSLRDAGTALLVGVDALRAQDFAYVMAAEVIFGRQGAAALTLLELLRDLPVALGYPPRMPSRGDRSADGDGVQSAYGASYGVATELPGLRRLRRRCCPHRRKAPRRTDAGRA